MVLRHARRFTRRRFISLAASAAGAGARSAPHSAAARPGDIINDAPYFAQGGTGPDSINNCGPAMVAAAIAYSGVASPSVEDVRTMLGFYGPTSTDQWTWLLDRFNVP